MLCHINHPSVNRRNLPVHSSQCFRFYSGDQVFCAEASDFNGKTLAGSVFNDAIDCGFIIKSHKTGREIVFVHCETDKQDGEIKAWRYRPLLGQGVDRMRVTIFND
jgi:hypothetical protein